MNEYLYEITKDIEFTHEELSMMAKHRKLIKNTVLTITSNFCCESTLDFGELQPNLAVNVSLLNTI